LQPVVSTMTSFLNSSSTSWRYPSLWWARTLLLSQTLERYYGTFKPHAVIRALCSLIGIKSLRLHKRGSLNREGDFEIGFLEQRP
jgi:hypothetical protein